MAVADVVVDDEADGEAAAPEAAELYLQKRRPEAMLRQCGVQVGGDVGGEHGVQVGLDGGIEDQHALVVDVQDTTTAPAPLAVDGDVDG